MNIMFRQKTGKHGTQKRQRHPPAVRGASTATAMASPCSAGGFNGNGNGNGKENERRTFNAQLPTSNKDGKSRPSLLNVERSKWNIERSCSVSTAASDMELT
jgi:hypothetical protein